MPRLLTHVLEGLSEIIVVEGSWVGAGVRNTPHVGYIGTTYSPPNSIVAGNDVETVLDIGLREQVRLLQVSSPR